MSIANPPTGAVPPLPDPARRLTVDEYHRLIDTGVLTEEHRVELLEGQLVPKMTRKPPHDVCLDLTAELIRAALLAGWRVRVQSAITLSDSEPEPDIAVVPGAARSYLQHHPGPKELALLIEVSESSLDHDRGQKRRVYAAAGIVRYWIVNLIDRKVEVYTEPTGPDPSPHYRQQQEFGINESVPLPIDGVERGPLAVRDLLP
jgi:Uma2 family endonuclease